MRGRGVGGDVVGAVVNVWDDELGGRVSLLADQRLAAAVMAPAEEHVAALRYVYESATARERSCLTTPLAPLTAPLVISQIDIHFLNI